MIAKAIVGWTCLLGALAFAGGCVATTATSPSGCVHDVLGCPRDAERPPLGGASEAERGHANAREGRRARERTSHPAREAHTPKR